MTRIVVGSVVNTVGFEIDKSSWANLNKFQERIRSLKKDMKGLSTGVAFKGGFGGMGGVGGKRAAVAQAKNLADAQVEAYNKFYKVDKAHGIAMGVNNKKIAKEKLTSETVANKKLMSDDKARASAQRSMMNFAHGEAKRMDDKLQNAAQRKTVSRIRQRKQESHVDIFRARQTLAGKDVNIGEGVESVTKAQQFGAGKKLSQVALVAHKKAVDDLNTSYRTTGMSASQYRRKLAGLNRTLTNQARQVKTLSQRFMDLRHNMLGIGIAGAVIGGGVALTRLGQDFESAGVKMLMATGSTTDAAAGMALAREQSKRLGLDILQTTDAFARLGIAADGSLSKVETNELFVSFAELATAAQIPKVQMDRGMRAMEQMLNKGSLMSEEVDTLASTYLMKVC